MGGAIARGLALGTLIEAKNITVVDPSQKCRDELTAFNSSIQTAANALDIKIAESEVVIFAVKPWLIQGVIESIKHQLNYEKQLIVSIAAGVSFNELTGYLKKDELSNPSIFRIMPNTAIAIRQSMTFASSYNATADQEKSILRIFEELGKIILIPENQMAAATALGSCGTAFAMRYIRAASEGGVELGFYPDVAKEIVLQTVKGAVELLLENGTHPEIEVDKVTTPGGLTIKGLNEMEHAGFTSAVIKGLKKSMV